MNRYERIVDIEREWQAQIIDEELQRRNIPHLMRSHRDSVLDGLLQSPGAWGHIEAPLEFKDEIIAMVDDLRNQPPVQTDESESSEQSEADMEEKSDRKSKGRTVSILLVVVLVIVGSWGLRHWYIQTHYVETIGSVLYVKTQATAIQTTLNLEHPSTRSFYNSHVVIEYFVDGKKVCGEMDLSNVRIREGDRLRVLYLKTQPTHCILK